MVSSPFEDYVLPDKTILAQSVSVVKSFNPLSRIRFFPMGAMVATIVFVVKSQSPFEDYVLPEILLAGERRKVKVRFQSPFEDYVLPDLNKLHGHEGAWNGFNPLSRITSFRTIEKEVKQPQ